MQKSAAWPIEYAVPKSAFGTVTHEPNTPSTSAATDAGNGDRACEWGFARSYRSAKNFNDTQRGHMKRTLITLGLFLVVAASVFAQDFTVLGKKVQVHGFASQGFVYTNHNNWLTMKTSEGSFAFTDFGGNISMQVTDKLRIGAQLYDRNLGELGNWHPSLDWAIADYRFTRWMGVRGGKVKTTLGLYNDSQDLEFLHTFALLPQSVYATDMRDSTIAHTGGDVYGDVDLEKHHLGKISYTGYAGKREDSQYGGYPYMLRSIVNYHSYGGLQYGGDLRWQTPLKGLLVGASRMNEDITAKGTTAIFGPVTPTMEHSKEDWTNQFYAQYARGNFQVDSEYRRYWRDESIFDGTMGIQTDVRGWYVAGSYRATKLLQFGAYFSDYSVQVPASGGPATTGKTYDRVGTVRFDVNRFTNIKIEGHFMDGYGAPGMYPGGFYTADNPNGFAKRTNALVIKTGFNF